MINFWAFFFSFLLTLNKDHEVLKHFFYLKSHFSTVKVYLHLNWSLFFKLEYVKKDSSLICLITFGKETFLKIKLKCFLCVLLGLIWSRFWKSTKQRLVLLKRYIYLINYIYIFIISYLSSPFLYYVYIMYLCFKLSNISILLLLCFIYLSIKYLTFVIYSDWRGWSSAASFGCEARAPKVRLQKGVQQQARGRQGQVRLGLHPHPGHGQGREQEATIRVQAPKGK